MIITIDTKKDTEEDIRKAVDLLKSLLGSTSSRAEPETPSLGLLFDSPPIEDKKPVPDAAKVDAIEDSEVRIIPY